jgi:mannose/cellobiose epimerase-like protein (N-acyl-D-glucosamine 2-epimerase family)
MAPREAALTMVADRREEHLPGVAFAVVDYIADYMADYIAGRWLRDIFKQFRVCACGPVRH